MQYLDDGDLSLVGGGLGGDVRDLDGGLRCGRSGCGAHGRRDQPDDRQSESERAGQGANLHSQEP